MKPPRPDDVDPGATAGPLNDLSLAVRSGRLVRLLKGEGLNRSTVEELLRPESLTALRAILTDDLLSASERGTREDERIPVAESEHRPADGSNPPVREGADPSAPSSFGGS